MNLGVSFFALIARPMPVKGEIFRVCKWYYPYPGDGPFSYEIIPSSAGLEFRKFRVTCRYCGAFVESDDGALHRWSCIL